MIREDYRQQTHLEKAIMKTIEEDVGIQKEQGITPRVWNDLKANMKAGV